MLFQQRIRRDVAGLLPVNNGLVLEFHHYFPYTGCCQIDALDEIFSLGMQQRRSKACLLLPAFVTFCPAGKRHSQMKRFISPLSASLSVPYVVVIV
jgi:hypothetical protein